MKRKTIRICIIILITLVIGDHLPIENIDCGGNEYSSEATGQEILVER